MRKLFMLLAVCQVICASLVKGQTNIPTSAIGPAAATPKPSTTFYYPEKSPLYQRSITPWMPITDTSKLRISMPVDSALIATQYTDPLGRAYETVVKGASTSKKDFVSFNVYDEFSRANTNYLPFTEQQNNTSDGLFKAQPVADDSAFYKGQFANENIYYGQQTYDASPLQRLLKTTAPGNSWTGSNVGISYATRANTASDSVRLWTIAISSEDDVPSTSAIYQAGSLMVAQVTDERGIKALVYTDELGRKVLTKTQAATSPTTGHYGWLCTYYIYDEDNHLRLVMPPKAVDALNNPTANWNLTTNAAVNTNLCFGYWYDNRGRVTMKRIPGKGKTYIAYDLFDRSVMTQDANLRASNQWSFISYDGQSRPDTTGLITSALIKDTIIAQAARNKSYPVVAGTYTITGVTYYDDYSWVSVNSSPVSGSLITTNITSTNFTTSYNTAPQYAQPITQGLRTRGMVTGSKVNIINSSTYLWVANIYDDHSRPIQSKQTNYSGGTDVATVQYSFAGLALNRHTAHQKSGTNSQNHTMLTTLSYDHVGRVKTVTKSIDNLTAKTISSITYNEIGQAQAKNIGNSIETQTYAYNIRGWLTAINGAYVNTAGSISNYFGETVAYDYGFTNNQLNGNIAGTKWKAGGDGIARAYGYAYDNANRLLTADFNQQNTGSTSWTKDLVDFTVSGLSYDGAGNIMAMKQRGLVDAVPTTVDSLTYQYFANSNQLQKVTDGATVTAPLGDFKDTSYTGDDYVYDANGNTLKDYNRHMHTTTNGNGAVYNYLDKAETIVMTNKAGIHYYYDAGGNQVRKLINDYTTGALVTKNYLYLNGFVYLNDTLQYVLQEEGQIRYAKKINSTTGAIYYAFEYDYFLKDHLGNVRTVLTEGKDTSTYAATMESADSVVVAATFSNVYSPVNTVVAKPAAFDTDPTNQNVAVVDGRVPFMSPNLHVGPSIVLKVMEGDQVQINSFAFYTPVSNAAPQNTLTLSAILNVLGNGIVANSGGKYKGSEVSAINNALSPNVANFLNTGRPYDNTRPKAYLSWILFDNQFNYIASNSGAIQVLAGSSKQALVAPQQNISKSGYLYVYVSNESLQEVYFDNIMVKQITGPLQQEQAYYPHNLPMAGLSDRALLKSTTSFKGNGGVELEEEYGLEYYNTSYRKYDAQIGRFNGVDVLSEKNTDLSPYRFGFNNPVSNNDPSGALEGEALKVWNQIVNYVDNGGGFTDIYAAGSSANAFFFGDGVGGGMNFGLATFDGESFGDVYGGLRDLLGSALPLTAGIVQKYYESSLKGQAWSTGAFDEEGAPGYNVSYTVTSAVNDQGKLIESQFFENSDFIQEQLDYLTKTYTRKDAVYQLGVTGDYGIFGGEAGVVWGDDGSWGFYGTLNHDVGATYGIGGKFTINLSNTERSLTSTSIRGFSEGYSVGLADWGISVGGNSTHPGLDPYNYSDNHVGYDSYGIQGAIPVMEGFPLTMARSKGNTWVYAP